MVFKVEIGNVNIRESRQGLTTALELLGLQGWTITLHKRNDVAALSWEGVAIVAFEKREDAQKAITGLDNKPMPFAAGSGGRLAVRWVSQAYAPERQPQPSSATAPSAPTPPKPSASDAPPKPSAPTPPMLNLNLAYSRLMQSLRERSSLALIEDLNKKNSEFVVKAEAGNLTDE